MVPLGPCSATFTRASPAVLRGPLEPLMMLDDYFVFIKASALNNHRDNNSDHWQLYSKIFNRLITAAILANYFIRMFIVGPRGIAWWFELTAVQVYGCEFRSLVSHMYNSGVVVALLSVTPNNTNVLWLHYTGCKHHKKRWKTVATNAPLKRYVRTTFRKCDFCWVPQHNGVPQLRLWL